MAEDKEAETVERLSDPMARTIEFCRSYGTALKRIGDLLEESEHRDEALIEAAIMARPMLDSFPHLIPGILTPLCGVISDEEARTLLRDESLKGLAEVGKSKPVKKERPCFELTQQLDLQQRYDRLKKVADYLADIADHRWCEECDTYVSPLGGCEHHPPVRSGLSQKMEEESAKQEQLRREQLNETYRRFREGL